MKTKFSSINQLDTANQNLLEFGSLRLPLLGTVECAVIKHNSTLTVVLEEDVTLTRAQKIMLNKFFKNMKQIRFNDDGTIEDFACDFDKTEYFDAESAHLHKTPFLAMGFSKEESNYKLWIDLTQDVTSIVRRKKEAEERRLAKQYSVWRDGERIREGINNYG